MLDRLPTIQMIPKMAFELSDRQKDFLDANGNTLVTGGAGSGKTTIAILKAAALSHTLNYESQKILFLSFARPTIARVEEAIQKNADITKREKSCIEVDTYHSFFGDLSSRTVTFSVYRIQLKF